MDKIYELKDKTKLIVYSYLHSVYTFSLPPKTASAPMSVASDYDSMLESCIFDSTVYYVYQNTAHNLIMSNLLFNNPHVIFKDEAQMYSPVIHKLFALSENYLCMTVTLRNPVEQCFFLEIWTVRPEIKRMTLPTLFSALPEVELTESGDDLFLYERGGKIHQVLQINKKNLIRLFEQSLEEVIDKPDIYQLLAARPLPSVQNAYECPNCRRNEEKIRSITRQYNDLVETAKQIQAEGLKWKNQYQKSASQKRTNKNSRAGKDH